MKIRQGFVSNSSSMSFIVKGIKDELFRKAVKVLSRDVITVKEVALNTFDVFRDYDETYFYDSDNNIRNAIKSCDNDTDCIMFASPGEDTRVFQYNNEIVINTSRHFYNEIKDSSRYMVESKHEGYPENYYAEKDANKVLDLL